MIVYAYDGEKQCSVPIISYRENELEHLKLMSKVKYLKFSHSKKTHLHHAIVGVTDNIYKHDAYLYAGVWLGAYWHGAYAYLLAYQCV